MDKDVFEFIFSSGSNTPKVKLPSLKEFITFFNSNKKDEEKAAYLLYSLILLDMSRKYPTAKEILKQFLKSNVDSASKEEIMKYLVEGFYINETFITDVGKIIGVKPNTEVYPKSNLQFTSNVLREVNHITKELGMVYANFDFIRREAIYWLIQNHTQPKQYILSLLKTKNDWYDVTTQNGILDYCYKNVNTLGENFVINIFEEVMKTNMREIRITAFRYAYLLTQDPKYIELMRKDTSSYIRKSAEEIVKNKIPVARFGIP